MSKKKITQERLKELFEYDPETGIFTRKVRTANCVTIGDVAGGMNGQGYHQVRIYGRLYQSHRLAWLYVYGYFPENSIDHINRIRHDNRIKNLREVSSQCNIRNSKVRITNKSGVTGVCWSKKLKMWKSTMKIGNSYSHLGYHKSKTEAAKARWNAEVKYNFPNCNTISSAYLYLKGKGEI